MSSKSPQIIASSVRILAVFERQANCGLFHELRSMMRKVVRQRRQSSHLKSLNNATTICLIQDGKRTKLIWQNPETQSGTSNLQYRKRDRLGRWLTNHILGRPQKKYGASRKIKKERREARDHKRAIRDYYADLDLSALAEELCGTPETQLLFLRWWEQQHPNAA